jgi:uncharacterized protein (TIGR03000 family)
MEKVTKVIVTVPEDAVLYVDGQKSKMTSRERIFMTPQLQVGARYFYDVRVEAVRDGEVKSLNKRVLLSAGTVARVDFTELGEASADASALVTVRLPKDARLFVDGTPIPQKLAVRKFTTPKLAPGQLYYYTVKVELDREGEVVTKSKRVVVEAGKKVEVTFEDAAFVDASHTASR